MQTIFYVVYFHPLLYLSHRQNNWLLDSVTKVTGSNDCVETILFVSAVIWSHPHIWSAPCTKTTNHSKHAVNVYLNNIMWCQTLWKWTSWVFNVIGQTILHTRVVMQTATIVIASINLIIVGMWLTTILLWLIGLFRSWDTWKNLGQKLTTSPSQVSSHCTLLY